MEKLFKSIKRSSIVRLYIRIALETFIILFSFTLDIIFDRLFYLIIGIVIAMIINVVILSTMFKKSRRLDKLTTSLREKYLPYMKKMESNEIISKAYNLFDYKNYFNIEKIFYGMKGSTCGIKVISQSLEGSFKFEKYYVRIYSFEHIKNKNINLYNIDRSILGNFRYEIKDDILYVSIINNDKKESFNPLYFKNLEDYEKRFEKEGIIINMIIKEIGGKTND